MKIFKRQDREINREDHTKNMDIFEEDNCFEEDDEKKKWRIWWKKWRNDVMPIMTYDSFGTCQRMCRLRKDGCRDVIQLYNEIIIKIKFLINI